MPADPRSVRIPDELWAALSLEAARQTRKPSNLIVAILTAAMKGAAPTAPVVLAVEEAGEAQTQERTQGKAPARRTAIPKIASPGKGRLVGYAADGSEIRR